MKVWGARMPFTLGVSLLPLNYEMENVSKKKEDLKLTIAFTSLLCVFSKNEIQHAHIPKAWSRLRERQVKEEINVRVAFGNHKMLDIRQKAS